MRRIRSVIAVACIALLLVAFAAVPAMAQDNNNNNGGNGTDRHLDHRQDVRLDRQLLNDNDHLFEFGVPLFFSHSLDFDNSLPFLDVN